MTMAHCFGADLRDYLFDETTRYSRSLFLSKSTLTSEGSRGTQPFTFIADGPSLLLSLHCGLSGKGQSLSTFDLHGLDARVRLFAMVVRRLGGALRVVTRPPPCAVQPTTVATAARQMHEMYARAGSGPVEQRAFGAPFWPLAEAVFLRALEANGASVVMGEQGGDVVREALLHQSDANTEHRTYVLTGDAELLCFPAAADLAFVMLAEHSFSRLDEEAPDEEQEHCLRLTPEGAITFRATTPRLVAGELGLDDRLWALPALAILLGRGSAAEGEEADLLTTLHHSILKPWTVSEDCDEENLSWPLVAWLAEEQRAEAERVMADAGVDATLYEEEEEDEDEDEEEGEDGGRGDGVKDGCSETESGAEKFEAVRTDDHEGRKKSMQRTVYDFQSLDDACNAARALGAVGLGAVLHRSPSTRASSHAFVFLCRVTRVSCLHCTLNHGLPWCRLALSATVAPGWPASKLQARASVDRLRQLFAEQL